MPLEGDRFGPLHYATKPSARLGMPQKLGVWQQTSNTHSILGEGLSTPQLFWDSEYYNCEYIGLEDYNCEYIGSEDYTSKCLRLKYNTFIYYKIEYVPYFYCKPKQSGL
jgi:hypothetical protein